MAIINQSNILNLQPGITAPVVVHMSEGDSGTKLSFKLIDGANAWTDPGNVVAAVHGRRQDGTQFGPYACTIFGDVVSFQTDAAMAGAAGSGIAQIVLTDGNGNTAGSANFAVMVERATFPMGVTYTNDVSVYEAILAYAQTIPAQVTENLTAKIDAETAAREAADATLNTKNSNLQSELEQEVQNRTTQDAVLSARMDEFSKLPSGSMSTAADAELVDIRVKSDGTTAATAGDAVRGQIAELKKDVDYSNSGYESIRMLSPFVQGATYNGEIQTYGKNRVANRNLITFSEKTRINIASGFWVIISFFVNGEFSSATNWAATLYDIPANSTVRFSIRRVTEDTSEVADVTEFTNAVTLLNPMGVRMGTNESDITALESALTFSLSSKGGITAGNYSTLGFNSVKDLPNNTIWGIGSDITASMITDLPSYGSYGQIKKTAGILPGGIYIVYEYTNENRDTYIAWQSNSGSNLSRWTRLATGVNDSFLPVSKRTLISANSKVIFIGDSIVAGVGGTGWQQDHGRKLITYEGTDLYANDDGVCWANMLRDYLVTNYGCTAYNNGLSGFNSVNIPQNIADLVPSDATHVIACWGINDRAYNYDTVSGYQTVIDYCNTIGAEIIPVTICPCLQPNDIYPHTQYEILTRVKTVCANNNLEVCDLFSAVNNYFFTKGITLNTDYIPDNLHPNDAMYTIMYNLMRSLLGV